jgi:hypothetical protein
MPVWFKPFVFAIIMALAAVAPARAQTDTTGPKADSRVTIELPAAEYEHVMHEMRQFLVAISEVVAASLKEDFKTAVAAAKASGRSEPTGIEKSIAPKLPPAFRQLAFDTHARFDEIAALAAKGDRIVVLEKVSELLGNCVSCHSSYAMRTK